MDDSFAFGGDNESIYPMRFYRYLDCDGSLQWMGCPLRLFGLSDPRLGEIGKSVILS